MHSLNSQVVSNCLDEIKDQLRRIGMTYSELAEQMELSEVTIKRMLNQNDIGFERLLTLCDVCQVSLPDIMQQAKSNTKTHSFFTDAQDKTFSEFPYLLSYFSELIYDNRTPNEIADKYQLSAISTHLYLSALENLELIRVSSKGNVSFLVEKPLGFKEDSRVIRKEIEHYLKLSCDAVFDNNKNNGSYFVIKPMNLPKRLYASLLEDISKIIDQYAYISEHSEKKDNTNFDFQLVAAAHPTQHRESTDIVNISSGHFDP